MKIYDLIIIGAGPAGMSAAIYAKRAMLEVLVLEKEAMSGGQIVQTYEVDNYPGLPKMTGMDLGDQFYKMCIRDRAKTVIACIAAVVGMITAVLTGLLIAFN